MRPWRSEQPGIPKPRKQWNGSRKIYSKLRADYKITYDPYTATTGSISNSLSFSGSMQLIDSETYTAPADAKVREIYVTAGQKVTDGTRLMRLSTGDTIEAGFDGTVSAINVEKGDEVKAEASLITVADFDHMRFPSGWARAISPA